MHNNPYLYEKYVQARQQELLREAEQQRLLARSSPLTPRIIDAVMSRLRAFIKHHVSAKPADLHVRTTTGNL